MIALRCILFACLVSLVLAIEGDSNKCERESGDKSLGIAALVQNYPDCRITCIKCYLAVGIEVSVTVSKGGYGCSNVEGLVNLGIGIGLCEIFGVELGPGQGTVYSS